LSLSALLTGARLMYPRVRSLSNRAEGGEDGSAEGWGSGALAGPEHAASKAAAAAR
jgi:hypothetical protein